MRSTVAKTPITFEWRLFAFLSTCVLILRFPPRCDKITIEQLFDLRASVVKERSESNKKQKYIYAQWYNDINKSGRAWEAISIMADETTVENILKIYLALPLDARQDLLRHLDELEETPHTAISLPATPHRAV